MKSGHYIHWDNNWGAPAFFVAVSSFFIIIVTKLFNDRLASWGFTLASKEI